MDNWKFSKLKRDNVVFFKVPSFHGTGLVKHCFTTRIGGVSEFPYRSMNLGTNTGDDKENVLENYRLISKALDIEPENLVLSHQVHKDNILIASDEHRGNGILYDTRFKEIDALITDKRNVALVTVYADCVPIFILDVEKKVIALAHGGWRGTVKKIGRKVIDRMVSDFGTNPINCIIGIGPSIGKCCYEVDDYVIDKFKEAYDDTYDFIEDTGKGKYFLDLWTANKISMMEAGVLPQNITISNICTKCNNELFFSYRGEEGNTGRMAAILQLI